ncbi:dihydropteroate synthase [Pasteurella bettyae]|nr:dihydropteroate synthase [Pasteurella bettyae]
MWGGESTRPNAEEVSLEQELDRVVPVVEAISQRFDCWISVDTSKPPVMKESAKVGMDMINDIRALQEPHALEVAVELGLPTCIMHMQGQPRTMQQNPQYDDVVTDVLNFLQNRTAVCLQAGMKSENIIWDMGFGFGKSVQHNYKLLQQLARFAVHGYPVLAGLSRKSMLGAVLNKTVTERTVGSATAALISAMNGATILRVHDVDETADALKIWQATLQA